MSLFTTSEKNGVVRNYFYNIAYQALTMVLPLITAPYLSRVLGASSIGAYSYSFSIANYFVLFGMLGINNHGCRSIAACKGDRKELSACFFRIYPIQLLFSLLSLTAYIGFSYLCINSAQQRLIFLILGLYVLSACFDVNWFFFGLEQFRITTLRNSIIKLVAVISVFFFVRDSNGLFIYTGIYGMSFLVSQLVLWPFLLRCIDFRIVPFNKVFSELMPCLKLFIPVIAVSLYTGINTVMLGKFSTLVETGIYDYANKFFSIPVALLNSLGTVMMPRMVSAASSNDGSEGRYMQISFGIAMMISGAFSFGLIAISPELSRVFLGPDFSRCDAVIAVLCIATPFIAWANVIRTQYLIPKKLDNQYTISVYLGCAVNLIMSYFFAKSYGAIGVAFAYLLAEMAVCIFQTLVVRNSLDLIGYAKGSFPFLLIGLMMVSGVRCISCLFSPSLISLLVEILTGASIYTVLSLFLARFSSNATACYIYKVLKNVIRRSSHE